MLFIPPGGKGKIGSIDLLDLTPKHLRSFFRGTATHGDSQPGKKNNPKYLFAQNPSWKGKE
jgi:hypothetical protein